MFCCQQSILEGYDYVWCDTCCIDKSSSAELPEAINSMFKWYKEAAICYAYLADVPADAKIEEDLDTAFAQSRWHQRGWTLQELIVPKEGFFFSSDWTRLGSKLQDAAALATVTRIDQAILQGTLELGSVSITERMSWAAQRQTTRVKDQAYCLMGLFDTNMSMLYGEGQKAFIRLQEEIIQDSDDETIFTWTDPSASDGAESGLLASSVSMFSNSADHFPLTNHNNKARHLGPYSKTNRGLQISVRLVQLERSSIHSEGPSSKALLNCGNRLRQGYAALILRPKGAHQFVRIYQPYVGWSEPLISSNPEWTRYMCHKRVILPHRDMILSLEV